jgi:signal transduction histidine kinase
MTVASGAFATHRSSIPAKAAATAIFVLVLINTIQVALIAGWTPEERTTARLALVLLLPDVIYVGVSIAFAYYIVESRTRRLTRVLDAVARGDMHMDLEPLLDADLLVVRDSLAHMRVVLDELTTRLRYTDDQRRRLFADLAHELATPATTILATAEAFANPALSRTEDARARIAACLDEEAARLSRLVRDVRDLARLDDPDVALEFEEVDVSAIVRRAVGRLELVQPSRRPIRFSATPVPKLRADPVRIDQAIMNILNNARRHGPPDGGIDVEVTARSGAVRITVEDEGAGVPDEVLPRLGERLFRADPARAAKTGGSGLGLSIVAAAVARHGGSLRFERASLGGLRVIVELPEIPQAL